METHAVLTDDGRSLNGFGSSTVRSMLHEQMDLINRALEFNQLILQKLDETEVHSNNVPQSLSVANAEVATTILPVGDAPSVDEVEDGLENWELKKKRGPLQAVRRMWTWLQGSDDIAAPLLSEYQGQTRSKRNAKQQQVVIFDEEEVKKSVKTMLQSEGYDVEDLYHTTGVSQALARNSVFKNATLLIIMLNTLWIAIDTDCNHADSLLEAEFVFQVVAHIFCGCFFFEILVRFLAFERKSNAFRDGWFLFDFFLVVTMVLETWVEPIVTIMLGSRGHNAMSKSTMLRSLRLLRIIRSGRVLRVLRAFPELMILVSAMLAAMRSVCSTLLLLILIMYVFAIVMTQTMKGTGVSGGGFETVPTSMNTLMSSGVFPDQASSLNDLLAYGLVPWVCFLGYLGVGVLTVMNLLIGIMCEVVGEVADAEKDAIVESKIKQSLDEIVAFTDVNGSSFITAQEFVRLCQSEEAVRNLHSLGIDMQSLVESGELLFKRNKEISADAFFDVLVGLRGSGQISQKDFLGLRKDLSSDLHQLAGRR